MKYILAIFPKVKNTAKEGAYFKTVTATQVSGEMETQQARVATTMQTDEDIKAMLLIAFPMDSGS